MAERRDGWVGVLRGGLESAFEIWEINKECGFDLDYPLHPPTLWPDSCTFLILHISPTRGPGPCAEAGGALLLEVCLVPPLRLAPGMAVPDPAVALSLHWHPQLTTHQLGRGEQGIGYVIRLGLLHFLTWHLT